MERDELIARLREFAGAALVERDGACFLVDPGWGERERAQWAALAEQRSAEAGAGRPERGWLCIPTGGSSGAMKLARHDELTLGAAVAGFCAHFGVARVDALGLLPPWHVSGLMAWARCVWTGGAYRAGEWKWIERGERPEAVAGEFVSLVPTQLARLLGDAAAEAWLRGFHAVLLGGGPAWPELLNAARAAEVPLAPSYGMTETAAMVAALRPEDFARASGVEGGAGRAMPGALVTVDECGGIVIESAALFRGYWPGWREPGAWRTDDLGEVMADGFLRVSGRADALIITGGEKVNPAEVEEALRALGCFGDVAVVGVPHAEWGSEVVALYPAGGDKGPVEEGEVTRRLAAVLAAAKRPKRYLPVAAEEWPRDARGKMDRGALGRRAAAG
jgi:O-succinylbenzoic acid--CoA ligase